MKRVGVDNLQGTRSPHERHWVAETAPLPPSMFSSGRLVGELSSLSQVLTTSSDEQEHLNI